MAKLSQPVPSSHGKCQCHLHMSQTSSPQAVVLLTPAWRCFVSAWAGCSGLQLNLSHSYQWLWFYHWLLQQGGNPQAHTVMFWCLKIVGSFLFGIFAGLFLLSNVVNVGNLISCLNDFHGCAQHPVMVLPFMNISLVIVSREHISLEINKTRKYRKYLL